MTILRLSSTRRHVQEPTLDETPVDPVLDVSAGTRPKEQLDPSLAGTHAAGALHDACTSVQPCTACSVAHTVLTFLTARLKLSGGKRRVGRPRCVATVQKASAAAQCNAQWQVWLSKTWSPQPSCSCGCSPHPLHLCWIINPAPDPCARIQRRPTFACTLQSMNTTQANGELRCSTRGRLTMEDLDLEASGPGGDLHTILWNTELAKRYVSAYPF